MVFGKKKDEKSQKPPNCEKITPEANANFFSKLIFHWPSVILRLGYERPLQKEDLYILDDKRLSKKLAEDFALEWKKEFEKSKKGKKPSLIKALNRMLGLNFWCAGIARFFGDTLQVLSPLVIQEILIFSMSSFYANVNNTNAPPISNGFILATILYIMQMGSTFFSIWCLWGTDQTGFKTRTILITTIYRKAMVLSNKARNSFTIGRITNLISTDTTRLDFFCSYFHLLWSAPLQLSIALALLILNIGPSALAGFGFLVITGPLQGRVMSALASTRSKAAKITDERIKLIQEILQGIRVIKYYAWEDSFLKALNKLRDKELGYTKFILVIRAIVTGVASVMPVFASILSFVVFVLAGGTLTPELVFSSLALFNIMRLPLKLLPMVIAVATDAWVSLGRIQEILLADELEYLPTIDSSADKIAIKVINGEFIWEGSPVSNKDSQRIPKNDQFTESLSTYSLISTDDVNDDDIEHPPILTPQLRLSDINFTISRGTLVAIVGSVGSGKSSLLSALVGEMKKVDGEIILGGTVGYCPQTAWIQNATLRENITFGLPFDEEKYQRVIKDCCLEPDLAILPAGDMTEIGEKGINLSGGQKQRINIARAVYYDADIVLLDDPLSAVDAHVGKYLFTNCIQGSLAKKTRILVTHQLQLLSQVDYIICMEDGEIAEKGSYEELMNANNSFAKLILEYGESKDEMTTINIETDETTEKKYFASPIQSTSSQGLMSLEERTTGAVANKIYIAYIRAAGGLALIPLFLFLLVMMQGSNIGSNLWLSFWTGNNFALTTEQYMSVYCAWGVAESIFSVLACLTLSLAGIAAARNLHNKAIQQILRTPINFFETTPLGRIINRFSKDIDACDNLITESYRMFFSTLATVFGTFALIIVVFIWFLVPLIPLTILYYCAAIYFRATNRELKRLDSILRSSLYAHFSESLTGLPTIRAYREQERFISTNENYMDLENRAYFMQFSVNRWLGIRLETIANSLIYCASLLAVMQRFQVEPAIIGLILSYATQVTADFNWCVRQFAEVEANMNAVERLVHYTDNLESEPASIITDNRPSPEWPVKGEIFINNLVIQYGPDNPPAIKGVTIDIKDCEKIGIVGRTGCGKSTLATSFFRLIEPKSGQIIVDGIDITKIGLKDLRSKITIIPQDPVLFNGTIRSNLDPFSEHKDLTLWTALRRAHLINGDTEDEYNDYSTHNEKSRHSHQLSVSETPISKKQDLHLDSPVREHGSNFSLGQQQLIALARALVRHSKLIIMDEATASVDYKTDCLIQKTIREEFVNSTVITIAHRLRTVVDYDKVLVMDAGKVIEFDPPYILLQNPGSTFRAMCESSGEFNELMELAKQKYESENLG
ncbi:ABC transporter [Gigaspora margarita]|uniref:ABC transporter n=1 Tax=Gigaspora margarita TaxID=4874 RepID=A0A8H4A1M5_GIGMA|nr:ABC transporter [Gigaspora margarita]